MGVEAPEKLKAITLSEKIGVSATAEHCDVSERTIYYWRQRYRQGGESALQDRSRRPKRVRKRNWGIEIRDEIRRLRIAHSGLGAKKIHGLLQPFCQHHQLPHPSASTIGRLIADDPMDPSNSWVRPPRKRLKGKAKTRKPKGFQARFPGHCVGLDTIVRYRQERRRYVLTSIDLYSRMAFAMKPVIQEGDLTGATPEALARALLRPRRRVTPVVGDQIPVEEVPSDQARDRIPHLRQGS